MEQPENEHTLTKSDFEEFTRKLRVVSVFIQVTLQEDLRVFLRNVSGIGSVSERLFFFFFFVIYNSGLQAGVS
jgi:hypothetical protein